MRNYWLRIALGALAIFTVGMIARALINRGLGGVHRVVEGSGPLSIPLAFIPFRLGGEKLGTLQRVTLEREAPDHVSRVELEVKLSDSALARGLEGCRLAANLDSDKDAHRGINIHRGPFTEGSFWCAEEDPADSALVEYGEAVFHPGDVTVPLYLPSSLVEELQNLDLGDDSMPPPGQAEADSIMAAAELSAESLHVLRDRMVDSLRTEGRRRADSTRRVLRKMADSTRSR
jgi:hypothetical protein